MGFTFKMYFMKTFLQRILISVILQNIRISYIMRYAIFIRGNIK